MLCDHTISLPPSTRGSFTEGHSFSSSSSSSELDELSVSGRVSSRPRPPRTGCGGAAPLEEESESADDEEEERLPAGLLSSSDIAVAIEVSLSS